ncbi:MAG: CHASE4 domain-containing protein [Candidatus Acidiferrales bacterium]
MGPLEATRLRFSSSLRGKTLLIIIVAMIGLVGGLYALSRVVLLRGFYHLEEDFARQSLKRGTSAVATELAALDRTTSDYSAWDQTYAFLNGKNPAYSKSEFPPEAFPRLKLNFIVILDRSGKKVFSEGFNLVTLEQAPVPADLDAHLRPDSLLIVHPTDTSKVTGILMLASGPALVESQPVLTSKAEGPIAGTLIMGRWLDSDEILRLQEMTHMPVDVVRLDAGQPSGDFQSASKAISVGDPVLIRPLDKDTLAAYEEMSDIYGKPGVLVRVLLPRTIYEQGRASLLQFLLLLLAAGLSFGAVTLYLLERTVLSRVADLSESITQIGTSGDLAARLTVAGQDELGYLGKAINGMLEDLENTESDRHEGRTRLGVMVENMPAVLWTTDTDLRFTSSMGAGLEALGLKKNEIVGKSLFEYFRTDDPEFAPIVAHRKALAGESVTYEQEWERRIFESHVQPLHSSEGDLLGVIGVALDITDRKHLADQLRQSQKMQAVGELAGGVAHDFNNLLMVVKGHAEMLSDRMDEKSPLRTHVEQVQKAADRAASLTRQLLAFSRKQVLQPRVLDLNEVVQGMIQMFSRVMGGNIELTFVPGMKLSRVKADPGQVEQVLLNLVVNARDAMPDGGRITIETANVELDRAFAAKHSAMEPGRYVMMMVTDTGCGMDQQTQSRIFEPFFTTKSQGRGTGLGLATVYGVVKQSGGFIWVYSEVNRGTTFKVYLPEVTEKAEKRAPETGVTAPPPGNETILFVEDEESVRILVREYLEAIGYRVLEAADGVQALEIAGAQRGPIHLLITDVVMPRVSGRELATQLAPTRPDLKVLYISGYTDDSVFRHGVLEGGVAFLQKPFNLKALAQKIREVLEGQLLITASPSRRDTV